LAGLGTAIAGGALILAAPELLVDTVVLPALNTMVLGNLGLTLTGMGSGYFLTNGKKETQLNLSNAFKDRIDGHIEKLAEAQNRTKINFIFNIESSVYPAYKKIGITETPKKMPFVKDTILPLNMENYYLKIGGMFRGFFKKSVEKRPFIEQIKITNAEMTDKQFKDLMLSHLGSCGTKILDLSKNRLTTLSIQDLETAAMNDTSSFTKLRSLNLSYNNLSYLSLDSIINIVAHLRIEELDLSGNDLNDTARDVNLINPDLKSFLENQPRTMPSLKVLKIADIGLTDNFSDSLQLMFKLPSILSKFDISHNPNLGRAKLQELLDKGFESNQSIRELSLDHRDNLDIEPLILAKEKLYADMAVLAQKNYTIETPRFIILLNRYCKNKHDNADMKDALSPEMIAQLDVVSNGIVSIRMAVFNVARDYSIPITEKEFVMFKSGKLDNYYLHKIFKNNRNGLDDRLFEKTETYEPIKHMPKTLHDLKEEKHVKEKNATLNDIKKPSVLKAI
jgi:hypothetical protein